MLDETESVIAERGVQHWQVGTGRSVTCSGAVTVPNK